MPGIQFDKLVKLTAWNVFPDVDGGVPFGTAMTAMDGGTAKLMKSLSRTAIEALPAPLRKFEYFDQLFRLLPDPSGGFRIVNYRSGLCLDPGDWFFNSDGSRTNVRHLAFKPIDAAAASQIFTADKEGYQSVDAWKLVCKIDGERFELTPNDSGAKEWVLFTLGKFPGTPSYNLFRIEPQAIQTALNVKFENNLKFAVDFAVRWNGGQSRSIRVDYQSSGILGLDGFAPPLGTDCWVVALKAKLGKDHESGDNFLIAPPNNDPYVKYSLNEGFYMNFQQRYYG